MRDSHAQEETMEMKSTTADVKIAGAVAGKLVNAKVRREVERALEAYPDADQLTINIARKYADRVLMR
jgi:hypothetical protein